MAWLLPLTLERVFHLDSLARGLIGAVNAAATFTGIQLSARRTIRWLAEGMGEPLKRAGLALALVGVGLAVLSFMPLALFVVVGLATSFVAGIFFPPFYTTQAFVSPARVRSLSYSYGALFIVAGVWLLYFLPGISAIALPIQGVRPVLGSLNIVFFSSAMTPEIAAQRYLPRMARAVEEIERRWSGGIARTFTRER